MSIEQKDRFEGADTSLTYVRSEFDKVNYEAIATVGGAREDVREAFADVEDRIDTLRERREEVYLVH